MTPRQVKQIKTDAKKKSADDIGAWKKVFTLRNIVSSSEMQMPVRTDLKNVFILLHPLDFKLMILLYSKKIFML